jgi:hypothetical protein
MQEFPERARLLLRFKEARKFKRDLSAVVEGFAGADI